MEKITDDKKRKYYKLFDRAQKIYCKTIYPPSKMRRLVPLMAVEGHDKGFDISINKGNKIKIIRLNEFGQLIGYGIIIHPSNSGNKVENIKFNEFGQLTGEGVVMNSTYGDDITDKDIEALNKAIKLYGESINIGPYWGLSHKYIGRIYQYLTLYDEAIKYFKMAIKINSRFKKELNGRIKDCEEFKKGKSYLIVEKS